MLITVTKFLIVTLYLNLINRDFSHLVSRLVNYGVTSCHVVYFPDFGHLALEDLNYVMISGPLVHFPAASR